MKHCPSLVIAARELCPDCLGSPESFSGNLTEAENYCKNAQITGLFDERLYTVYHLLLAHHRQARLPMLSNVGSYRRVIAALPANAWDIPQDVADAVVHVDRFVNNPSDAAELIPLAFA